MHFFQFGHKLWSFSMLFPNTQIYLLQFPKAIATVKRYLLTLGEIGKVCSNVTFSLLSSNLANRDNLDCSAKIVFYKNQVIAFLDKIENPMTQRFPANQPALLRTLLAADKYKKQPVLISLDAQQAGDELACFDEVSKAAVLSALPEPQLNHLKMSNITRLVMQQLGGTHAVEFLLKQ